MNENINNRLAFNIYVLINFCLSFFAMGFFILFLIESISGTKAVYHQWAGYTVVFAGLYIIFTLFDLKIKPAYFEARINYGQICIKSFSPNTRNRLSFFLMLFYRKYTIEYRIDRQSYNNYRIEFDRLGFKKSLILQKTENGKIYESKPISISFLGPEKYTSLLLSIDRIKEKISLN